MDERGYVHNVDLDALGIPIENQHTNFLDNTDKRWDYWMKEREEYGFDTRETWNLDRMFVEWIYTRFKFFRDVNGMNMEFHKFNFRGKEITQGEAIDIICAECASYLTTDFIDRNRDQIFPTDIMLLLNDLLPVMWW